MTRDFADQKLGKTHVKFRKEKQSVSKQTLVMFSPLC